MEQLTTKTVATPARCRPPRAAAVNQQGMVLFIALIVLVAMTLAGIALVRSVDTANVIAGNLTFKQATLQAGDLGVEAAFNALPTIIAGSVDTDLTPAASSTNPNYWYYASRRTIDANGVPTQQQYGASGTAVAIDWTQVPIVSTTAGNAVQIVIDRLCQGPRRSSTCWGNALQTRQPAAAARSKPARRFSPQRRSYITGSRRASPARAIPSAWCRRY